MRSVALLCLLVASPALGASLTLSENDFIWSARDGNLRFTLALHVEDMSYPSPGVGQLQLTITGHVEQPNYRHRSLSVVGMEIYGDVYDNRAHAAVRTALAESAFSDPRMSASTFSPGLTGPSDPITYAWIDFATGVPSRELDWTTTAMLLVNDVDEPPSSVLFASHYRVTCPPKRGRHCDSDLGAFPNEFNVQLTLVPDPTTSAVTFRIAMIPEPSTGLLLALGLVVQARPGARRKKRQP